MIPIGDDNSDRIRTPYVNYILLAANILVFVFLQQMGQNVDFTYAYSTVPGEIMSGDDIITDSKVMVDPLTGEKFLLPGLGVTNIHVWLTLLTSMFMHGGLAHLGGNMLYLWVFGDNIENRLGHLRYLLFYLLTGIIASLTHVLAEAILGRNLLVPSLGASGAISGILGAYILLFPGRKIHVFFGIFFLTVPAIIVLGLWILFQVLNGMGTLGGQEAGSIAYAAHIGGFIAGLVLIKLFDRGAAKPERQRTRTYWR
ncbi:MAG TPA: rhomboid family intramembrane serine protease [Chitinophagaceae bacterium]|nr:rhomboid family intramembrane serine protease [Chitinophagaceae bacterium]